MLQEIKDAIVSEDLATLTGLSIGCAIDYVLDGDSFDDLEGCVKTFIGTKFEKNFVRMMNLPYGKMHILDTNIAGYDIDIKFTLGNNWMIPPECINQFCLLCQVSYPNQTYRFGLFQANPEFLTKGFNRDQKRSVSAFGKKSIDWLLWDQPVLPPSTISSSVLKSSSVAVSPSLGRNIILPSMASSSDPA